MSETLKLDSWTKNYSQEGDCCSSDAQFIIVEQDDGGGGPYWIIKTERWAFDDVDELVELLMGAGVGKREPKAV